MLRDVCDCAVIDIEGDNAVGLRPLRLRGGKRRDGLVRNAQDIGEAFQHQLVVLDVGTREHGEGRTVSHELHVVAIEDASAWCDGRVLVDAVALCLGRVLGTGDDLHRPQLDDERADARADDGDEAEEATTRRALGIAAGPAMGLGAHGEFGSAARVDWDARGPAAARSHDDDDDGDGHDYEKNADCRKDCCRHALISLLESRLHAWTAAHAAIATLSQMSGHSRVVIGNHQADGDERDHGENGRVQS